MNFALEEAKKSLPTDVPVGCVIVRNGQILARGHNTRERDGTVDGHAELSAIRAACAAVGDWRLSDCDLYVTLEPCPMCAGAIRGARIRNVYFGAPDPSEGAAGSVWNLLAPHTAVWPFVMQDACAALLCDFFPALRPAQSRYSGSTAPCASNSGSRSK